MKAFAPFQSSDEKYYIIGFTGHDIFKDNPDFIYASSYHVLDARLLGFTYSEYLKYCRANGAVLKGKRGYSFPTWKNRADCQKICNMLEKEWNKLVNSVKF